MTRISRSTHFKTIIGVVMTLVMVISLFAGIGAIWVNEDTGIASAATVIKDKNGVFANPKTDKKQPLYSEKNPFTILEIVPNPTMAQFGYLVEDQEPIDLLKLSKNEAAVNRYQSLLNEYVAVSYLNTDPLCYEFDNLLGTPHEIKYGSKKSQKIESNSDKLVWSNTSDKLKQYGEYVYDANGEWVVVERNATGDIAGYALLKETKDTPIVTSLSTVAAEDPQYDGKKLDADYTSQDFINILKNSYGLTVDNSKLEKDATGKNIAYYEKVDQEGKGVYSGKRYDYSAIGGPYSLIHHYVGEGNGDEWIKIIKDVKSVYATDNTLITYNGKTYGSSPDNAYRFKSEGRDTFIAFKRLKTGDDYGDVVRYSIKTVKQSGTDRLLYSNNIYYNNNNNSTYHKRYKLEFANSSDYDITENGVVAIALKAEKNVASDGDNVNTVYPTSIDVVGTTFTRTNVTPSKARGQEYSTSKPAEYDNSIEFAVYDGFGVDYHYRYDGQYLYLREAHSIISDRYYKFEYKNNNKTANTFTFYFTFVFDTNDYNNTLPNGFHYVVLFDEDADGKYVVDTSVDEYIGYEYEYHMSYKFIDKEIPIGWRWEDEETGIDDYENLQKTVNGKKIIDEKYYGIPQAAFNGSEEMQVIIEEPEWLGEYTVSSCLEGSLPVLKTDVTEDGQKKVIYSKDYDRYYLVPILTVSDSSTYELVEAAGFKESYVAKNRGRFHWNGLGYYENKKIIDGTAADREVYYDFEADDVVDAPVFLQSTNKDEPIPARFKWFQNNQSVSAAYTKSYTSKDLFKKYSIGLAYIDNEYQNEEDVDRYKLVNWYKDKYGVNEFNIAEDVDRSMTVYAKWLAYYPKDTVDWNGYTVSFNENIPENETITDEDAKIKYANLPAAITGFSSNSVMCEPYNIPIREDKTFKGWLWDDPNDDTHDLVDFVFVPENATTIPANASRITGDVTLYAKWDNVSVDSKLYSMQFVLDNIDENHEGYTFSIDPTAATNVTDIAVNGRRYYEAENEEEGTTHTITFDEIRIPRPVSQYGSGSVESDWEFAGWYFDEDLTISAGKYKSSENNIFTLNLKKFNEIIANLESSSESGDATGTPIYLFAKWVKISDRPIYTITMDVNSPDGTVEGIDGENNKVRVTAGVSTVPEMLTNDDIKRSGNVETKRKNYNVRVITVTPEDLNNTQNLKLISDADLIVINETCDPELQQLWYTTKSETSDKYLFLETVDGDSSKLVNDKGITVPKPSTVGVLPSSLPTHFYETTNLSWAATTKILSRITGYEYNSRTKMSEKVPTCPVLYDYNIYKNCTSNGTQQVSFTSKSSDSMTITVPNQNGSDNNLYKLYLLTQLSSPVTMYNAFFTRRLDKYLDSDGTLKAEKSPDSEDEIIYYTFDSTKGNAGKYWSKYTLIPYNVIDKSEWDNATNRAKKLELLGYNMDIEMSSGKSNIKNRMFVYNSYDSTNSINLSGSTDRKANLVKDYRNVAISDTTSGKDEGYDDLFTHIGAPKNTDKNGKPSYYASDVFYYMLHSDTLYTNLERDINVLEIQPYTYRHYDEYWFWYISRYAKNVTGKITGTAMSSLEFQSNIDDLNAKYDVIYFGTNQNIYNLDGDLDNLGSDVVNYYQPKGKDNETVLSYYHVGNKCDPEMTLKTSRSSSAGTKRYKIYDAVGTFNTITASGDVKNDDITTTMVSCGNDLTFAKFKDIATFLSAGYPIIFDDSTKVDNNSQNFFNNDGSINTNIIDSASWIYKLVKEVTAFGATNAQVNDGTCDGITTKDGKYYYKYNWYKESGMELGHDGSSASKAIQTDFLTALKNKTFSVVLYDEPNEYYDTKSSELVASHNGVSPYINGDDASGSKALEFELSINSIDNSKRFRLEMFIDTNADGNYDPATEKLDNVIIKNLNDPKDSGRSEVFVLKPYGTEEIRYKVTRDIQDYAGMIPWKIQVVELDENSIKDEKKGLCAIKVKEEDKVPIYVLQITNDEKKDNYITIDAAYNNVYYPIFSVTNNFMDIKSTIYLPTDREINSAIGDDGIITDSSKNSYFNSLNMSIPKNGYWSDTQIGNSYWRVGKTQYTRNSYGNLEIKKDSVTQDLILGATHPYYYELDIPYNAIYDESYYWNDRNEYYKSQTYATKYGLDFPFSVVKYKYANASKFHYYTRDLNEFDVHFVRINLTQLRTIANATDPDNTEIPGAQAEVYEGGRYRRLKWKELNMIIMGFGEGYNDIEDYNSLGLINDYIETGKTILFTVRTTSHNRYSKISDHNTAISEFYNNHPMRYNGSAPVIYTQNWAGYNITEFFADIAGQDRFGAHKTYGDLNKVINLFSSELNGKTFNSINLNNAKDITLKYDAPFLTNSNGMTLETDANSKNGLAWTGKVSRGNNATITGNETANNNDKRVLVQGFSRAVNGGSFGNTCDKAVQTNEGQIVTYPYQIGSQKSKTGKRYMELSYSYSPAIQLNTEDDDVVVWFTLYDEGNPYANIVNDSTNNYYIYSKKNVTYSGIGTCQGEISDDECKLFVNTMVAAYRASAMATQPRITNPDRSEEDNKDCLYVDYDASSFADKIPMTDSEGNEIKDENGNVYYKSTNPIGEGIKSKLSADGSEFKLNNSTVWYKQVDFELQNYSILMQKAMTVHYYPVVYKETTDGTVKVVMYDCPLVEMDSTRSGLELTATGDEYKYTREYGYTLETYTTDPKTKKILPIRRAGNLDSYPAWTKPNWIGTPSWRTLIKETGASKIIDGVKFPYIMPEGMEEGRPASTSPSSSIIDNIATIGVGQEGLVDSSEKYFVDIPISKNYYSELFKKYGFTGSDSKKTYYYKKPSSNPEATPQDGSVYVTWSDIQGFGLDNNAKFEIEIQIVMRYGKTHSKNTPLVGIRDVVFMKRGMFTLD